VTGPAGRTADAGGGWRECVPELSIASVFVATVIAASYAFAGLGAALIAVSISAVALMLALRALVPPASTPPPPLEQDRPGERAQTSFFGFWRKRAVLLEGCDNMAAYDAELRQTLQHLLAARLAERHDISLYADPARARQVFLGGRADELWYWLDPDRAAETDKNKRGIPPRTLTAIIDRLERL
jgi:hypothetical protein